MGELWEQIYGLLFKLELFSIKKMLNVRKFLIQKFISKIILGSTTEYVTGSYNLNEFPSLVPVIL